MHTVELVGRLIIALSVVLAVIWVIAKKVRGGARSKLHSDKLIDVLGRQSLSRNSSLAVVRVADRALIVGVTDTNVRMLGEMELDAVAARMVEAKPETGAKSFATKPEMVPATGTLAHIDDVRARRSAVSGSALSPATWKQTIDALREMTARKG